VGSSASHNPIGLHGVSFTFTFFYIKLGEREGGDDSCAHGREAPVLSVTSLVSMEVSSCSWLLVLYSVKWLNELQRFRKQSVASLKALTSNLPPGTGRSHSEYAVCCPRFEPRTVLPNTSQTRFSKLMARSVMILQ
jgi:hypothetical protein